MMSYTCIVTNVRFAPFLCSCVCKFWVNLTLLWPIFSLVQCEQMYANQFNSPVSF